MPATIKNLPLFLKLYIMYNGQKSPLVTNIKWLKIISSSFYRLIIWWNTVRLELFWSCNRNAIINDCYDIEVWNSMSTWPSTNVDCEILPKIGSFKTRWLNIKTTKPLPLTGNSWHWGNKHPYFAIWQLHSLRFCVRQHWYRATLSSFDHQLSNRKNLHQV